MKLNEIDFEIDIYESDFSADKLLYVSDGHMSIQRKANIVYSHLISLVTFAAGEMAVPDVCGGWISA